MNKENDTEERTVSVINTINNEIMFTGTVRECEDYIRFNDNGFLTLNP